MNPVSHGAALHWSKCMLLGLLCIITKGKKCEMNNEKVFNTKSSYSLMKSLKEIL